MKSAMVYGLFNDSCAPVLDGVTLTVENYIKWLIGKGHRVSLVTPKMEGMTVPEGCEPHTYFSLPIYNRHPYRYGYPWFDPMIWRTMKRVGFRIVHAHCPFSSGRLARYAARHHNIPLVATFHSKYRTDLVRSLPPYMVEYQMRRMREFYDGADAVWIPQAEVEETVREYGIKAEVTVVENGNDLLDLPLLPDARAFKEAARQRLGIPRGRMVLLFVGQHIREKGVLTIIDSLAHLQARGFDFEMHFAGTGYALGEMQRLVKALGLDYRVTFHGVVANRSLLIDLYSAASLFVFPSRYDNAPLVVREASAMATPALLAEGSTSASIITDGRNGFTCQPQAAEMAARIASLGAEPDRLIEVGLRARAELSRPWSKVMEEIDHRYDELISRHGRRQ